MASINPSSTIKLLRNVPLEPDYINTLYFATASAQTTYFNGKAKYTLSAQSYQRVNKGVCRVNYRIEDIYDCNYLMFQNVNFENKWFYAFITKLEYVNNVTTDIYYEIDVMQTWLKDMHVKPCFVEREHSATDNIGDNIVPEMVDTGEMVYNEVGTNHLSIERLEPLLDKYVVIIATLGGDPNITTGDTDGNVYDGIYTGLSYRAYLLEWDETDPHAIRPEDKINEWINLWNTHPDDIVAIYLTTMAAFFVEVGDMPTVSGWDVDFHKKAKSQFRTWHQLKTTDTLDGHTVRNKKLFTYPFNYVHVDNANGKELNLRYEFFKDINGVVDYIPKFEIFQNMTMPVVATLRPCSYKNSKSDIGNLYTPLTSESLDLTNYPICPWTVDTWRAWVAQNSVPEAISAISSAIKFGIGAGAMAGGVGASSGGAFAASEAYSGIDQASNILSKLYKASIQSDICKGSYNNGNLNIAEKTQNFFISRVSVNKQMAEIIDDYFDKFGYATNRVKVPYLISRPAWNYVKTIGSNVDGNIPGDDKRIIDANFDKGITFWHNPDRVDDYTQNNAPVSP